MATPDTRVFIAFDLTASGGTFFSLNDPVRGVLDSSYVLGGDVLVDVTDYVANVTISRGKSRELDQFQAGHATVTLHNDDRTFDPFYVNSPYHTQILPRKAIAIEINGERAFSGYIDDWDLSYDVSGKSFASVSAIDGFFLLTAAQLEGFTNVSQKSGERVVEILNRPEVAWSASLRDIDTGLATMQADTVDQNTNVLSYLQLVEKSENGALFMNKAGAITFRDRLTIPPLVDTVVFADDGTGIGYTNIEVRYGSENLYNRVVVTNLGGTAQVADSLDSQDLYGVSAYSIDGILLTDDTKALELANYLVGRFDQPELRIESVTATLEDKNSVEVEALVSAEINDVIRVKFTPNKIGDAIDQYGIITGIEHNVTVDRHTVTIKLGSVQDFPLILDNPIYGRLGGSLPVYDDSGTSYDDPLVRYDGSEQFGYILAF